MSNDAHWPDLYHYTSVSGLKGIVESGCLHATNIKYLNDSQEFHFGLDYFSKAISRSRNVSKTDILVPEDVPLYDHLIELILDWSVPQFLNAASEYFVVSFSANPDILSQWRAYGRNNVGYCMKFDHLQLQYPSDSVPQLVWKVNYIDPLDMTIALETLEELKNSDWRAEFFKEMPWLEKNDREEYKKMLKRMYELDQHDSTFTEEDKDSYPDKVDMSKDNPAWYKVILEYEFWVALPTLSTIAISWKDHSFNEEDEHRLVLQWSERSQPENFLKSRPVKFKEGKTYLIPYIEIPYDFKKNEVLKEVIVGPCPHPSEAASSARQFLAQNLKNGVTVRNSKIPFRFW
jgi:hypothetical protein